MALKDSQKDMHEHSAKKVELLRRYLDAYLAVLGYDPYTDSISCHDLFCGEGIYPNGGEGSPIVFAKALRESALRCPNKVFSLHFNDREESKVTSVKRRIEEMGTLPKNLAITSSTLEFDDVIRETKNKLPKANRDKAFLFVDPYGYKDIKPTLIQELMQGGRCEVLLFLPTQQMFRFSKNGTPEALREFLDSIRQGREFPVGAKIADYIAYIVDGFRLLMPESFVDSFTIRKDPQTSFCLFFFTSNLKGAEKMLEAKWALDDQQGAGWSFSDSGYEGSLFQEPLINPLEKVLERILREAPQSNTAIYEATIHAGFLPKHAKQVLSAMQKQGRIAVDPPGVAKGTFYLNYKATHGADLSNRRAITIQLT